MPVRTDGHKLAYGSGNGIDSKIDDNGVERRRGRSLCFREALCSRAMVEA